MRFLSIAAAISCAAVGFVEANQSESKFEVVSIRRNVSGGPGLGQIQAERYNATAASIHPLILNVYGMRPDQLVGVPSWVENDRLDIIAKAPEELTSGRWRPLRPLTSDWIKRARARRATGSADGNPGT